MIRRPRWLLAALAMAAGSEVPAQPALPDVTIYMARFESSSAIGENVTATLNLGLWRTLRKTPWPANPKHLDFGNGLVIWSNETLPAPASRSAAATLRENPDLDMILWGSASPYGPDVIVQSYLLVRPLEDAHAPRGALWTVRRGDRALSLGLPRALYVLGTVPLRRDVVNRFRSPSALRLCATRQRDCAGPQVGPAMRALEHSGPWTQLITPERRQGWVYVPELGDQPSEIVAFTGALIAYYRGDFDQAERLFGRVADTQAANALVKEDAATLRAASLAREGKAANSLIDALRGADPYSTYALQVALMDGLQKGDAQRLRALSAELRAKADLFDEGDDWPRQARGILAAFGIP
ncbi:MAG TPA: hypothetical protein VKC17_07470 [Sphingomicrobium sp.]|nr:hypothetical protein [Sphingomicrobium sp.]